AYYLGDYPRALMAAREVSRLAGNAGDRSTESEGLGTEAAVRIRMGELSEGVRLEEEIIRIQRAMGNVAKLANWLANAAQDDLRLGNLRLARERAEEGLKLGLAYGLRTAITEAQVNLGWMDHIGGARFDEARKLFVDAADAGGEDKIERAW